MSVQTQIDRLTKAKSDLKVSITNKGVAVSDDALISDYPALVAGACDGEACVQGDLYRLHFPSAILSRLDAYEGIRSCEEDEYERRLLPVALADGSCVEAWVYCYRKSVDVLEWMEGGVLQQVLRVVQHQPLYGDPSLDFVPALYMPLYYCFSAISVALFGENLFLVLTLYQPL